MPRCGTTAAWGCRGKAVRWACYQSQAATLRLLRPRKPLFLSSHQAEHLTTPRASRHAARGGLRVQGQGVDSEGGARSGPPEPSRQAPTYWEV